MVHKQGQDELMADSLVAPATEEELVHESGAGASTRWRWLAIVEDQAGTVFFAAMFVAIVIGVFWRYVLDTPLLWTTNAAVIAFVWMTLIGSGSTNWKDEHIRFELVFDHFPPRLKLITTAIGNLLLAVPFVLLVPYAIGYISELGYDKVSGTPFNFSQAFSVVVLFSIATALHRIRIAVIATLEIFHRGPGLPRQDDIAGSVL